MKPRKFPSAICAWCERQIGLERRPPAFRSHLFATGKGADAFICPGSRATPGQAAADFTVEAERFDASPLPASSRPS